MTAKQPTPKKKFLPALRDPNPKIATVLPLCQGGRIGGNLRIKTFLGRKEIFYGVGCFTVISDQDTEMNFGFGILKISPTVSEIALPIRKLPPILPL